MGQRSPWSGTARRSRRAITPSALVAVALAAPCPGVFAHGFAGKRFFPSTLTIDDPFVADEANFLLTHINVPAEAGGTEEQTVLSADWSKRITRRFGFSIGTSYDHLSEPGGETLNGFENLELGVRYLLGVNAEHEALLSVGVDGEIGGTGSRRVGAESSSTISPGVFFGKGMGDLPSRVWYLRPLAVTGVVAPNFTTGSSASDSVTWGFTVQYNLQYLQSFVKDVGLQAPFSHMIPIVEFPMQTCVNRGCSGETTGTVNPGVVWFGRYGQFGLEAAIPVNERTGSDVGVLAQFHFYLDDLFPHTLGAPLVH